MERFTSKMDYQSDPSIPSAISAVRSPNSLWLFLLIACTGLISALPEPSGTRRCEHRSIECTVDDSCGPRDCSDMEHDKINYCVTLWKFNHTIDSYSVLIQDCFISTDPCNDTHSCVRKSNDMLFCCCEGDMCNANRTFPGLPPTLAPSSALPSDTTEAPPSDDPELSVLTYSSAAVFLLAAALLGCYLLYRHRKSNLFNELPTAETSMSCPPSPATDAAAPPVVLLEVRARGRFGAVWRARLHEREVAVKVFPLQDKQSWLSEQEIYQLPRMTHPDILHYIGVDKKGDNLQSEYWLTTAYHEKGSLCDYLKAHTLTWGEAWRVAASVARGLTHLHDECAADSRTAGGAGYKPAVAHRDFKSKNVLLKNDMSACIADFGLALVFRPGEPCGDTHGQVGTRRYMAPEVLEGAINFTKDAFLRIDMYACGLVLWEIVSRCVERGEPVTEYRLPLEDEVGSHPSLEDMQEAVVLRKMRPKIPAAWRAHSGLAVLCDTMEECWDHDAEARLSASCVLERVDTHAIHRDTNALLIEDAALLPPAPTIPYNGA